MTTTQTDDPGLFVDGEFRASASPGRIVVLNPATEQPVGSVPAGCAEDVDEAVAAAHRAQPGWAATPPTERARLLRAMQAALEDEREQLAATVVAELGMPWDAALDVQVDDPARMLGAYADLLGDIVWEEPLGTSLLVREPVGVAGLITPWNYPLYQVAAKAGAALAAGCTVVVKPSELAPFTVYGLARAARRAGLPPGVLGIVMGSGPVVGEALVRHPLVRMVSFTGSTRAGRRVAELAAAAPKPVALELGGKSATIVLDDADLDDVVPRAVADCFRNSGQTCSARSRLLVPAHLLDRAVELAARAADATVLGDPTAPGDHLGPLVSAEQRERVLAHVARGVAQGARVVAGGPDAPTGFTAGYWVRPTVLADVDASMDVVREEIFGPVLVVQGYADEDDAVRQANDSPYGLSGAVWSSDAERATGVARRLETGEVYVNGGRFNIRAPFGGVKQSGYGRELGALGILEFTHVKALHR